MNTVKIAIFHVCENSIGPAKWRGGVTCVVYENLLSKTKNFGQILSFTNFGVILGQNRTHARRRETGHGAVTFGPKQS